MNNNVASALVVHANELKHTMNFVNIKIQDHETSKTKRLFAVMIKYIILVIQ